MSRVVSFYTGDGEMGGCNLWVFVVLVLRIGCWLVLMSLNNIELKFQCIEND